MARSKREQYMIIGVAIAVGLWALDRVVTGPYFTAREAVAIELENARADEAKVGAIRLNERRMQRAWAEMRRAGIEAAPSEVEGRILHSMRTWAQSAGVTHLSLRPARLNRDHGFVQVLVHAGGSGSTAAVAKLLWSIESATGTPVRVEELLLTPAKEGADELQIELTVSTLCATTPELKPQTGRPGVVATDRGGK